MGDKSNFIKQNKVILMLGMLGILLFSFGILLLLVFSSQDSTKIEVISADPQESSEPEFLIVHVSGAVEVPGLYKFTQEARMNDALVSAGGLSVDANRKWFSQNINLAEKIIDGQKIYIPHKGEEGKTVLGEETNLNSKVIGSKININTANASELQKLPNVGESTAQKIIEHRKANGKFIKIDDIKKVSGIGEKTFAELKELISI